MSQEFFAEPKVLIVDDQVVNCLILERLLASSGFRTLIAADGPTARAMAVAEQPDLILLDIMLPGESGFETMTRLKEDPRVMDIPVIFLTALDQLEHKVKGFDLGAVDYVTKPFEVREVLARIRTQLKLKTAYTSVIAAQARRLRQVTCAQQAFLSKPEEWPEAGFGVRYLPVLEAGGDFYEVLPVGNGFGYFVADVSGHDITASFATTGLKVLLQQNAGPIYTPQETLRNINRVLKAVLGAEKYVSAAYVLLNRQTGTLQLLSAGHLPLLFVRPGQPPRFLQARGDILGVFDQIVLEPMAERVQTGDRFYLFTDGLVEHCGSRSRGVREGLAHLATVAAETEKISLEDSLDRILAAMIGPGQPSDDVVLLGGEV